MSFIDGIKSKYTQSEFVRNVLTLMTGTTIAQAIPIAISPILSRIYSPSDYGLFALFMSVASIISIVATGRYEMAVMLPEEDEDAVNIVGLSLIIAFFISLLTLIVVWLFNDLISALLANKEISEWLYFIPLTIFLTGAYQTFNYWSNRKKQYKRLAISRVFQAVATSGTNLGMGLSGFGVSGLIGAGLIGQGVSTGVLGWQVWREDKEQIKHLSREQIKKNAVRYKDFPLVNSLQAFGDVVQSSGVIFVITAFFGSTVVGLYSFTMRVLTTPLGLISSSVGQVFYEKASATAKYGGDLQGLVKRTMIKLGLIALPICLIFLLFGPALFSFVFSSKWREAGVYMRILAPWIFLRFMVAPLSQIPLIVNKQKSAFYLSLLGNSLMLISIIYGGYFAHSIKSGFYILSFTMSIYMIYLIYWFNRIANIKK